MTARQDDLTDELAREIRAAVAQATPPASRSPALPETKGFEEVRTPLARAEGHVTPTVPDATRFFGAKSAAVRLLRFLWRNQASFNALLLEAGNGVAGALEENRATMDRLAEELARSRDESLRRDAGQDARLAYLESLRMSSGDVGRGTGR